VREATDGVFDWSAAGSHGFKGIDGEVELFEVARA
jgi:hypothetical protein